MDNPLKLIMSIFVIVILMTSMGTVIDQYDSGSGGDEVDVKGYTAQIDGAVVTIIDNDTEEIVAANATLDASVQYLMDGTGEVGEVYVTPGSYVMSAPVYMRSGWSLMGAGDSTVLTGAIRLVGETSATTTDLAVNASQGATVLQVADASSFHAGDYIKIEGTGTNYAPPGTGSSYTGNYEGSRIANVVGNSITLENKICNAYKITEAAKITKVVPVSNATLSSFKLVQQDYNNNAIHGYWVDAIEIKDITIDANTAQGIYLATAWDCTVDGVSLTETHDAINLEICSDNNIVRNCDATGGDGNGIDIALFSKNNLIDSCTFTGITSQPGIALEYGASFNTVSACSFSANGVAVSVTYESENNTVEECVIEGSTSYGIYVSDSGYNQFIANRVKNGSASGFWANQYANHTLISGGEYSYNQVNALSRGIYFKYSSYVEIKGVVAEQNNEHGILLSNACNYCHVHNNTVWDNGQAGGTHTQDGIVIATNCDYNVINSNSVSNSPRSEIRIHSVDCDNNTVFGNVLSGTHDVAFYDGGTGTVAYDNAGV